MRCWGIGIVAMAVLGAGCLQPSVEDRFDDADRRFGQSVNGGFSETRTVEVPEGTQRLRVAAAWEVTGGAVFALEDPRGTEVQETEIGGTDQKQDERWYEATDPRAGTWELSVEFGGSGGFSLGFYLE